MDDCDENASNVNFNDETPKLKNKQKAVAYCMSMCHVQSVDNHLMRTLSEFQSTVIISFYHLTFCALFLFFGILTFFYCTAKFIRNSIKMFELKSNKSHYTQKQDCFWIIWQFVMGLTTSHTFAESVANNHV